MALKYVGRNASTDWLPGIPARDLSTEEESKYPRAKQSKLYQRVTPKKPDAGEE